MIIAHPPFVGPVRLSRCDKGQQKWIFEGFVAFWRDKFYEEVVTSALHLRHRSTERRSLRPNRHPRRDLWSFYTAFLVKLFKWSVVLLWVFQCNFRKFHGFIMSYPTPCNLILCYKLLFNTNLFHKHVAWFFTFDCKNNELEFEN